MRFVRRKQTKDLKKIKNDNENLKKVKKNDTILKNTIKINDESKGDQTRKKKLNNMIQLGKILS